MAGWSRAAQEYACWGNAFCNKQEGEGWVLSTQADPPPRLSGVLVQARQPLTGTVTELVAEPPIFAGSFSCLQSVASVRSAAASLPAAAAWGHLGAVCSPQQRWKYTPCWRHCVGGGTEGHRVALWRVPARLSPFLGMVCVAALYSMHSPCLLACPPVSCIGKEVWCMLRMQQ